MTLSTTRRPAALPVPVTKQRSQRPRRGIFSSWASTLVAAIIGIAFALPALWILIGSFRPNQDVAANMSTLSWSMIFPSRVTLENYVGLLTQGLFGGALVNSLIVCVGSVVIGVAIAAAAAYALSVFEFRGREFVFALVVISFMIPFEAIAIPLSQLFTSWGLGNTIAGLILPGVANGLAIFNLRQHFLGIPNSYREAAMLDGASEPRILVAIYARMSGSALTNSALLIFLGQWTSYLWPLLVVSDDKKQLAPIALAMSFGDHSADYAQNFAGSVLLSLIPAVSMFVIQKFFGGISIASGEK